MCPTQWDHNLRPYDPKPKLTDYLCTKILSEKSVVQYKSLT